MIAPRVPKLGRLGARLTAHYGTSRRHTGVDIYVPAGTVVHSPIGGRIESVYKYQGRLRALSIRTATATGDMLTYLKPVLVDPTIVEGMEITAGQPVGRLDSGGIVGGCNRLPVWPGYSFLHLEIWAAAELGSGPLST